MANVIVEKNRYTVDSLRQWDRNQVLTIYGLSLPSTPEIHFTNDAMDRAIVRQATMTNAGVISVDVPNSLLQKPYKIRAYVCIYEGASFRSLYMIEIPVKARPQPNDYTIVDDDEIYSFNALENKIDNELTRLRNEVDEKLKEAVDTCNSAADSFENHTHDASAIDSGVFPIERGGTNSTTAKGAEYEINGSMVMSPNAINENNQLVFKLTTPNASSGVFVYKTIEMLWAFISKKIQSEFGLSADGQNTSPEIQCGTVDDVSSSGVTVTFPKEFSGVPVVVATGGSEVTSVRIRDITTTSCRICSGLENNDGVQWLAVYIPQS